MEDSSLTHTLLNTCTLLLATIALLLDVNTLRPLHARHTSSNLHAFTIRQTLASPNDTTMAKLTPSERQACPLMSDSFLVTKITKHAINRKAEDLCDLLWPTEMWEVDSGEPSVDGAGAG
jgi:hypothetical protein